MRDARPEDAVGDGYLIDPLYENLGKDVGRALHSGVTDR